MNSKTTTFGILGLLLGVVIGFSVANYLNRNAAPTATASADPTGLAPANPNTQSGSTVTMPDIQKVLDKAKNKPESFDAQIKAGELYAKRQRLEKAIEYFVAAQKLKPADLGINIRLGGVYFDSEKYEESETYFLKALEIEPKNADIRSDLGLTF